MTNTLKTQVTVTVEDLSALADKISKSSNGAISRPAALNMIASGILGPKHDWGRIKNAEEPVRSQRVAAHEGTVSELEKFLPYEFEDLHDGQGRKIRARIQDRGTEGLEIKTEDGVTVWVEYNDGLVKTHVYTTISDGPVSVWASSGVKTRVEDEGYIDGLYQHAEGLLQAGDKLPPIVGYQVASPYNDEHWGDRPSFEVLPRQVALNDFLAAQKAEPGLYDIYPVREGEIEEPTFAEA